MSIIKEPQPMSKLSNRSICSPAKTSISSCPPEIISRILFFAIQPSSKSSARITRTCTAFKDYGYPWLYEKVVLKREAQIEAFFGGVVEKAEVDKCVQKRLRRGTIVNKGVGENLGYQYVKSLVFSKQILHQSFIGTSFQLPKSKWSSRPDITFLPLSTPNLMSSLTLRTSAALLPRLNTLTLDTTKFTRDEATFILRLLGSFSPEHLILLKSSPFTNFRPILPLLHSTLKISARTPMALVDLISDRDLRVRNDGTDMILLPSVRTVVCLGEDIDLRQRYWHRFTGISEEEEMFEIKVNIHLEWFEAILRAYPGLEEVVLGGGFAKEETEQSRILRVLTEKYDALRDVVRLAVRLKDAADLI